MARKQISTILVCSVCFVVVVAFLMTNRTPGRVFSEELLQTWGYTTSSVDHNGHHIRSIKNYGNKHETFYARFILIATKLRSEYEAISQMKHIKKESGDPMKTKDYRQVIQDGCRLITVASTSNYTRLEHQPKLLALIQTHLKIENP